MGKIISYRQKLIELARIYKIDRVFDQNLKHSTYDIEIILLKNNVPIPSRRGYFSHKLINEVYKPFYGKLKKFISINTYLSRPIKNFISINTYLSRPIKNFIADSRKKITINTNFNVTKNLKNFRAGTRKKLVLKFDINIYLIKFFDSIEDYFKFIIFNIVNFFKILTKTIINGLNDIYNFKVREKILKNIFSKAAYSSLAIILIFSGFYVKNIITGVDSLKISLEIKSDKKEIVKNKKNNSKELSKLPEDKKSSLLDNDYNLNTQTVLNLFEDLEYDLDNVRNKKKVKPIYFTRLPKDLDTIKSVNEKKETFLQILLPLVVAENEKIREDREYLLKILKTNKSPESKKWLNKKYKAYKVSDKSIKELIEKIDIIPTSIALAQAAKESGWGTSRFALEGNAIYGQWTWNGDGIEPLGKTKDQKHKILKFPLLRASVKAYITNLNTHRGYKSFRVKRAALRKQNKKLAGLELIHELENYAQTGKEYTKILEKIIKQNDLDELEAVTIDDFKESKELKL